MSTPGSKQNARRKKPASQVVIHPNAAGIDIGAEHSYVAVPSDRDDQPIRKFGCFTEDLHALANWLKACDIETVAMESTGVYWVPLFQVLESRGFEVFLVNARHVKNVPGRKTDVLDCQWIQQSPTTRRAGGMRKPPRGGHCSRKAPLGPQTGGPAKARCLIPHALAMPGSVALPFSRALLDYECIL